MQELRNLRKLHASARERIVFLEAENKRLKARVTELEAREQERDHEIIDLQYQLNELKTIVFGKARKARDITENNEDDTPPTPPRTKDSYRRPIPKESEVTKVIHHRFPRDCHGNIRERTYYVEDIPLDIHKTVEKHVVEQYYDKNRRVWISKDPLPCTVVTLGDNVRVLVATLITVERLSYSQVQGLLRSLFHIDVSSGEIATILHKEAILIRSADTTLRESIRAESSHHLDESRYDIAGETHYVWSMTGGESGDSSYLVGVSRGKGNAVALRGNSSGVLISDDYGAYRTLAEHHQLCFAHLIRKFRDLAEHDGFSDVQVQALTEAYHEVRGVYRDIITACTGPDPQGAQVTLADRLTVLATIGDGDPTPLVRIKTTLMKNVDRYLTCLRFPMIALTNNAAERSLRHIVLKRKISFGCGSHRGGETMSVLFSVLLSLWRRDPITYVAKYREVRRV
jgi:hypothetical protein